MERVPTKKPKSKVFRSCSLSKGQDLAFSSSEKTVVMTNDTFCV